MKARGHRSSRSSLSGFLAYLGTIRGDLSNITGPPFFLAPVSVVELPSCWTERPSLLAAPAMESDPQIRALCVLKWILCSLRSQFYVRQDINAGMRKPLNAFLGELFFGQWTDDTSTANIITEQVSHHPPITACYMWDEENGIRGNGYTRVEMSFSGSLNVKQIGHAMLHIDKYDEDYLIPIIDFKIKGLLSGKLYPELSGTYHIISSAGFISEINFSGQGFFSGTRNSFEAKIYRRDDNTKQPIYTACGQWSGHFFITDANTKAEIDKYIPDSIPAAPLQISKLAEQDPWETRRAWKEVLAALKDGNLQKIVIEKSKLEDAQRAMRQKEQAQNVKWQPKFFTSTEGDPLFEKLASGTGWLLKPEKTKGVWRFDEGKAEMFTKPYYGTLTPFG